MGALTLRLDLLTFTQILSIAVVAVALHVALSLYLMQVLNDAFDPDWQPRMLFPSASARARYLWTHHYSGAVLFARVRRTVFEGIQYDFRRRVSRSTVYLCVLHQLCALVVVLSVLMLIVFAAYGAWWVWQHRPQIIPSILRPDGVPETE